MSGDTLDSSLAAYYRALTQQQSTLPLSHISVDHSPIKGRYLRTAIRVPAHTQIFAESAVLSASDNNDKCLACSCNHSKDGGRICAQYRALFAPLKSSVTMIEELCEEFQYPVTRAWQAIKFVSQFQHLGANGSAAIAQLPAPVSASNSKPAKSIAATFAENPVPTSSFSFAVAVDEEKPVSSHSQTINTDNDSIANTNATTPVDQSLASLSLSPSQTQSSQSLEDLGFQCILSLDAGSAEAMAEHRMFADAFWRILPINYRRQCSVATLARLFSILELNSHELMDSESQHSGEGLFPFFAMIEHACKENCAFTQLVSTSANNGKAPVVSVLSLVNIDNDSALSISYCPPYLPTKSRRSYLQQHYHFHCQCGLCSGEQYDKARGLRCECGSIVYAKGEGATVADWECEAQCGRSLSEPQLTAFQRADDELEMLLLHLSEDFSESGERERSKGNEAHTAFNKALALCQFVCDNQSDGAESSPSPPSPFAQSSAASEPGNEAKSKTQLKNAKRRAKEKATSQLARLRSLDMDQSILSALLPHHYLVHSLMDSLIIVILEQNKTEFLPVAVKFSAVKLENARTVLGAYHWMVGVEWSQQAELHALSNDWQRALQCQQRCLELNQRCFGENSTATQAVLKRYTQLQEQAAAIQAK